MAKTKNASKVAKKVEGSKKSLKKVPKAAVKVAEKAVSKSAKVQKFNGVTKPTSNTAIKMTHKEKTKPASKTDTKTVVKPAVKTVVKETEKASIKSSVKSSAHSIIKEVKKAVNKASAKIAEKIEAFQANEAKVTDLVAKSDLTEEKRTESKMQAQGVSTQFKPSTLSGKVAKAIETEKVEKQEKVEKEKPEKSSSSAKGSKKATSKVDAETSNSNWDEVYEKYKTLPVAPYKMSDKYFENTAIDHKTLGWGFILSVVNDRLEVLFQNGVKHLISNYKAS
jgi:hypothetical protein